MSAILTAERLNTVIRKALYHDGEVNPDGDVPEGAVTARGVVHSYGFHPQRIEEVRADISEMIGELDPKFLRAGGGGFTFLGLPFDKNGEQWGEQVHAEGLLALAIGLGLGKILVPKELWSAFPGGVPYVAFWQDGQSC